MRLKKSFFERPPQTVAKELLGADFVKLTEKGEIRAKIVETEAYGDATDLASHARFGCTKRNQLMFEDPGVLYIYHIYGIFYLTNIICESAKKAGAVLIRSVEILEGKKIAIENIKKSKFAKINELLATGPGKFSIAFDLTKEENGKKIINRSDLYIEKKEENFDIIEAPRVGIEYAKESKENLWRYYILENKFVSRK